MRNSKVFLICAVMFGFMFLVGCHTAKEDRYCGDDRCDRADGENYQTCPEDCEPACGDGSCDSGETSQNCSRDCQAAPVCGDGACNGNETSSSCPSDCPVVSGCSDPNYPVDCHDGTGCWSAGTNCASNVFICGGQERRCSGTSYVGFCCYDAPAQCPATAQFFCPQDGACYNSQTLPSYCNGSVCSLLFFDC